MTFIAHTPFDGAHLPFLIKPATQLYVYGHKKASTISQSSFMCLWSLFYHKP